MKIKSLYFAVILSFLSFIPLAEAISQSSQDAALRRKIESALNETQEALRHLTASTQETQAQIDTITAELETLHKEEEALKTVLSENIQKHHLALANLARLERQPLRALLTYDLFKVQPQRQPILAISRKELQNRIKNNRKQLAELLRITRAKEEHQQALNIAATELEKHQTRLAELEKEQQELLSLPPAERRNLKEKAETLAKKGNLKQLLALTNSLTGLSIPEPSTQAAQNLPVDGLVLTNYGQRDLKTDIPANGMIIEGISGQEVIALHEGRVLYAGPFKGFGILVILEHAGGIHSLYGGIGRSHYDVGTFVPAGVAIASLPEEDTPQLYLEIRENGKPINPQKWLTADEQ